MKCPVAVAQGSEAAPEDDRTLQLEPAINQIEFSIASEVCDDKICAVRAPD